MVTTAENALGRLWGRGRPLVTVLRLSGAIGQGSRLRQALSMQSLSSTIEKAFRPPRLTAVALQVNSPGGSPVQSSLIAARIRQLAREKDVPVLAFAEDVAASGGYWLATAGDEIFADRNSIIGSIGVVFSGFGFPELLARMGVERRLHVAGENKGMLDPFRPEDARDVAHLREIQKRVHEDFIRHVRERRGRRLKGADDVVFSGAFWSGGQALDLGLIDGIGDMTSVLKSRFGDKVRIKPVGGSRALFRRPTFTGARAAGGGAGEPGLWADQLLAAVEERALWGRFGL